MKTSATKHALVSVLAAATFLAAVQASAQSAGPTLEGVWRVTRHGVNCQTGQQVNAFPALMTFHGDGTVSSDAVGPGSTAAEGTSEHGLWQRAPGNQNYSFCLLGYGWDGGAFEGSSEITGNLQMTSADSFAYEARIQIFDAAGNLLVAHCGKASGTRFR